MEAFTYQQRTPFSSSIPHNDCYRVSLSFIWWVDGKSTFGELWWLVPEDDPIARRLTSPSSNSISGSNTGSVQDLGTRWYKLVKKKKNGSLFMCCSHIPSES